MRYFVNRYLWVQQFMTQQIDRRRLPLGGLTEIMTQNGSLHVYVRSMCTRDKAALERCRELS